MSVTCTKVASQAIPTSVVTQTTEDTHTLQAMVTPTIPEATIPTIMATATPTTATTHMTMAMEATLSIIITIITIITPTNVKMSDYNGGVIQVSQQSECYFQGCGQRFSTIAHLDKESEDARREN
jgi:hypothetical protein